MSIRYYPAVIDRANGSYGISFPDFPGCVSAGDTPDAAALNGEAVLRLHLRSMIADGDPIPTPSSLEAIAPDPEADDVARVLIRAELPGKAMRLNISLDEGLVSAIDGEAARRGMNRSAFLAEAARRMIDAA